MLNCLSLNPELLSPRNNSCAHPDGNIHLFFSLWCDERGNSSVFFFLQHTPAHAYTLLLSSSSMNCSTTLGLYSTGLAWSLSWYNPTWWEVVMTHEQRTFGASPKYVTVRLTHLICYNDFSVMKKNHLAHLLLCIWVELICRWAHVVDPPPAILVQQQDRKMFQKPFNVTRNWNTAIQWCDLSNKWILLCVNSKNSRLFVLTNTEVWIEYTEVDL